MLNINPQAATQGLMGTKRLKKVYHTPSPNTKLREHRNRLLSELVALDGLPEAELRKRYYEIHPQIRDVYQKLRWKKQQLHQTI